MTDPVLYTLLGAFLASFFLAVLSFFSTRRPVGATEAWEIGQVLTDFGLSPHSNQDSLEALDRSVIHRLRSLEVYLIKGTYDNLSPGTRAELTELCNRWLH